MTEEEAQILLRIIDAKIQLANIEQMPLKKGTGEARCEVCKTIKKGINNLVDSLTTNKQ